MVKLSQKVKDTLSSQWSSHLKFHIDSSRIQTRPHSLQELPPIVCQVLRTFIHSNRWATTTTVRTLSSPRSSCNLRQQATSHQNRSTFAPPPKESGYIPAPPPPPPASPATAAAATPSGYQQSAYAGLPRHGVENFISRPLANYPQPAVSHYPSLPVMELMETRHQPTAYRPPTEASTAARYNSMFFRNGTGERYSRFQSPLAIQVRAHSFFSPSFIPSFCPYWLSKIPTARVGFTHILTGFLGSFRLF